MSGKLTDYTSLQQRVTSEQVRLVYRHLPFSVVLPVIVAWLIAFQMRDHLPHAHLSGWAIWVTASYLLLPPGLYLSYRRVKNPDPGNWGMRYTLMVLFTASSWGSAGVLLFVPDSLMHQLFLCGMLFAGACAVMATAFPYTPGYYAGSVPMLAPLAVRFAYAGEPVHLVLVSALILAFIMLSYFQHSMHHSLTEALRLSYENQLLIAELERKHLELEAANQAKTRFLAAASHDLRQPLHAQRLFLGELLADLDSSRYQKIVGHMRDSMESMDRLLNELLDISRLDAGVVNVDHCAFRLAPLLSRIEHEFSGLIAGKGLRFKVVQCDYAVYGDAALLERILRNLLHNAARYTRSGAVMVLCRRRKSEIAIEVRDSGPGIPLDQQSRIFEEFSQLGNSERNREKGLGLGLAIVARLAALLNYRVSVSSRPGAGSTFTVCVPEANALDVPRPEEEADNPAQSALKGMRVLVVDDDRDIMDAMTMLLDRWGCQSRMLPNGAEAQRFAGETGYTPDVIIVDYRLPGEVNGIDLIRILRMHFGTIPAVVITGDTEPSVLREAQMNDCILMHKPLDAPGLYGLLANLERC